MTPEQIVRRLEKVRDKETVNIGDGQAITAAIEEIERLSAAIEDKDPEIEALLDLRDDLMRQRTDETLKRQKIELERDDILEALATKDADLRECVELLAVSAEEMEESCENEGRLTSMKVTAERIHALLSRLGKKEA